MLIVIVLGFEAIPGVCMTWEAMVAWQGGVKNCHAFAFLFVRHLGSTIS